MRKQYLTWVLVTVLGAACTQRHHYTIEANVPDCNDCKVILWFRGGNKIEKVDSSYVQHRRLQLRGVVAQPGVYEVSYQNASAFNKIVFYLPADSVRISVNPNSEPRRDLYLLHQKGLGSHLQKFQVASSAGVQQHELEAYLTVRDSMWNKYFVDKSLVNAKLMQTYDTHNKALISQWADSSNKFNNRFPAYMMASVEAFARHYPRSLILPYAIMEDGKGADVSWVNKLYSKLTADQQHSTYGKLLVKRVQVAGTE